MDLFLLTSFFRLYRGLKLPIEFNSVTKNILLSAFFCWEARLFIRDTVQKILFGGTIGYGDSYLEILFRHFRVFRLHAIVLDAAGAVRAQNGKGPGYSYMIGRGSNLCQCSHVIGLLFAFT